VVGHHEGIHAFTIGQRKRLGVALGEPAFVVRMDAVTATVHLGVAEALLATEARLEDATWAPDVSFPMEALVRIRARHEGTRAGILRMPVAEGVKAVYLVRFHEPVRAISPGQAAVAYDGDRVLGGGTITAAGP
jgi:tRNA-specific 2-thiouridylase